MKTMAILKNNEVVNIVVIGDDPWGPGPGFDMVDVTGQYVSVGFIYDPNTKSFSAPLPQE